MKIALLALGAGIGFAQSTTPTFPNSPFADRPLVANAGSGQPFDTRIVTGRPFTAEAVIETDQTLTDGSHIVNRQSLVAARDSLGRTHREEILSTPAIGDSAPVAVFISDPVAKANYFLGPDHIAHNTPMPTAFAPAGTVTTSSAPMGLSLQRFSTATGGGKGPLQAGNHTVQSVQQIPASGVSSEPLGTQVIAGFAAMGTRTTITIPAGVMGNQNPLVVVTEKWYSQDLQATVLVKHQDPRFGASSYQFANVQQTEPPDSLFAIPAGYTVEEDGQ